MDDRARRTLTQVIAVVVGILLILFLRGTFSGGDEGGNVEGSPSIDIGNCLGLYVTASSEKAALLTQMAADYNSSDPHAGSRCVRVVVTSKASGGAMEALARGWNQNLDGQRPDIWTPASSSWVPLLEQRLALRDAPNLVPTGTIPHIASSPLVIAMPQPMAEALGWPTKQLGWSDVFQLAQDPRGWGAVGHPEWGAFTLGKTNPNFSTSGLNALIGTYFAATGLSSDLSLSRIAEPKVQNFVHGVESSVVHYGDTTLTFLSNLQRADDAGAGLTYVSAVAVEEKSVWDYNQGNPTGDPATLGRHAKPSVPLVAIYPKEGTLISDHPWVLLDAPWVDDAKRQAAAAFLTYLQAPAQQQLFQRFAFRDYKGTPGSLITQANGLLPAQPKLTLAPPSPPVLDAILKSWESLRKRARVLILIDVSGSMGESVPNSGETKLELAKQAAVKALDLFSPDDDVGLWVFTTDLGGATPDYRELVPIGPLGNSINAMKQTIRSLQPLNGTPLYSATHDAVDAMRSGYDPSRINGVVLLTDGRNEDPNNSDLNGLLSYLHAEASSQEVRVFPIAYGSDADLATLTKIANASQAAVYDASDPTSIDKVFVSVISNF